MEKYRKRGRGTQPEVQATQVARPYRKVKHLFPRSHIKNRPSGQLDYIRLIDAAEGANRARENDWIIKHLDGTVEVLTDEQFHSDYRPAPAEPPAID